MNKLLTRQEFKELVFKRDKSKCVVCGKPAVDAHHIFDRKLFDNGGYYLNNGASVCSECHIKCEKCEFSVEFVKEKARIDNLVYPECVDPTKGSHDKWGKLICDRCMGRGFFSGYGKISSTGSPEEIQEQCEACCGYGHLD